MPVRKYDEHHSHRHVLATHRSRVAPGFVQSPRGTDSPATPPLAADATLLQQWCETRIPAYIEELKARLLGSSLRANVIEIRVDPSGSHAALGAPPWTLNARAARPLVEEPLSLYLENDSSDWKFLCAVGMGVKSLLDNKAVRVFHGGGTNMEKKIAEAGAGDQLRWRTFLLFDSDCLHPKELVGGWKPPAGDGCQGYQFERLCAASAIPASRWRMLQRRSIENYLPPTALSAIEPACAAALFSPTVGQMFHHYNIKKGLQGDGIWPADPAKAIRSSRSMGEWHALPPADKDALKSGFGTKVSDEFANIPATYRWEPEIVAEADAIVAALYDAI